MLRSRIGGGVAIYIVTVGGRVLAVVSHVVRRTGAYAVLVVSRHRATPAVQTATSMARVTCTHTHTRATS